VSLVAAEKYLHLKIPYLPPLNTAHTRRHWAVAHKERHRIDDLVLAALPRGARSMRLQRARIRLVRHSSVEPDFENMALGFKGLIDSLVSLGVLVDDGPRVLEREYAWEYAPRGKGQVSVSVAEVEP